MGDCPSTSSERTNAGETPALRKVVNQPHLQGCYRLVNYTPMPNSGNLI